MAKKLIALIYVCSLLTGCASQSGSAPTPSETPSASISSAEPTQYTAQPSPEEPDDDSQVDIMHILTEAKTTQFTTGETVSSDDLETILSAGLNAPSAVNYQPWHFSVITDQEIIKQLGDEVLKIYQYGTYAQRFNLWNANTAILISADESPYNPDFDCGLAAEAMSITAQYLGYGTKFLAHPNAVLNGENSQYYKDLLQIPDDHYAVAILLIGVAEDSADAVSSASVRADISEKVSFIN